MSRFTPARRTGISGWAVYVRGAEQAMPWTLCTTRREARLELKALRRRGLLKGVKVDVVPVRIQLLPVESRSRRGRGNATRALPLARDIA